MRELVNVSDITTWGCNCGLPAQNTAAKFTMRTEGLGLKITSIVVIEVIFRPNPSVGMLDFDAVFCAGSPRLQPHVVMSGALSSASFFACTRRT